MKDALSALRARWSEIEAIRGALGVLEWDQQVKMPKGGAEARGEQIAALSGILHDRMTDPALGELLDLLQGETDPVTRAMVRNVGRRYQRSVRVPTALVSASAQAASEGFAAWLRAREARSWALFQPALERLVSLAREVSACYGPAAHPYDQLLEEYDPGSTTAELTAMFSRLSGELSAFVGSLAGRPEPDDVSIAATEDDLLAISRRIAAALGYEFAGGRLDVSQHPFTVGIAPGDVRITTHPYANQLSNTLWGTIHETGHALYEQGLPAHLRGTSLCEAASTGVHESQSRFWENFIGRSLPFCVWLVPVLREQLPSLEVTADQLYRASNRVRPSLIRIHADEATYNLHILVRFELETALIKGDLAVSDLPDAWDAAYERLLGLRPPDLLTGVLQDVHWSSGLFGYFPSYTIGNLYAASLAAALVQDMPDLWQRVAGGDFAAVLSWLRSKVHSRGHLLDGPDLLAEATGGRDPVADFMDHLRSRQGALYGVG